MTPLYQIINSWKSREFVWGECDCMTVLADWREYLTGEDPMQGLRGTYDSAISCQRVTKYLSDPLGAVERCIPGVPRTLSPVVGDVAVLRRKDEPKPLPIGAIKVQKGWVCKSLHFGATGLCSTMVTVEGAWRMGYNAP